MNKCVKWSNKCHKFSYRKLFFGRNKKAFQFVSMQVHYLFFLFSVLIRAIWLRKSLFVKYNCTYENWPAILPQCFLLNWLKRRWFVVADCFSEASECLKLVKGKSRVFMKKYQTVYVAVFIITQTQTYIRDNEKVNQKKASRKRSDWQEINILFCWTCWALGWDWFQCFLSG